MNLRPQKRYEPKGPKAFMNTRHKNMNLRAQDVFMFVCEPTKKCEHKAPKILQNRRRSRSMFCECIWEGASNPPPAVWPTSSAGTTHPHLKRLHLQLKPKKNNNSQNISAPQNYIMLYHTVSCYFTSSESMF